MTGSTIIIEVHAYRGVGGAGGPLGSAFTLGFVTITYVPFLLTEWLRERLGKLKNVAGDSRGFVEMGVWDAEGRERSNSALFQKFPNGIHRSAE